MMTAGPGPATNRNRDGMALRRRLLLWSAVPVLLMFCVAVKLLSLGLLAGAVRGRRRPL
jgi:hypothetical protein